MAIDHITDESVLRMMKALLLRSVNDYFAYGAQDREYVDSRDWLFFENGGGCTSFRNVCRILGLNQEKVRFYIQQKYDQMERRGHRRVRRMLESEFVRFLDACDSCWEENDEI